KKQKTKSDVDMSRLMSKWYGDSQKYISALFSLAKKMAPSIIWIDEIDALFSQRSRSDHQADVYNKALFLSLWDGLASSTPSSSSGEDGSDQSSQNSQVIILGATNRPHEVDEAFLRRMGRQYEFSMPDKKTRKLILSILLQYERYDNSVNLDKLADVTDQYSGSDLKEFCKYAATLPLREYVRNKNAQQSILNDGQSNAHASDTTERGIGGEFDVVENEDLVDSHRGSFWKSLYTLTPGFGPSVTPSGLNRKRKTERAIDRYSQCIRSNKVILRAINMKDFDQALQHVKSTLKAHRQHENTFGNPTHNTSMMNLWGTSSGLANFHIPGLNPYAPISKQVSFA
ncbi:hypothetical protein RFI_19549, partial [Reticulomyxa filosa]